jgi:hypothetical protein
LIAAVSAAAEQPASGPKTLTFDADPVGLPPAGFEFARTGQGAEGNWVVRADKDKPGNHVLVQESADPTDYRFPLAVLREGTYRDVTLSVRSDATDDTFKDAGRVGLWTKADSVIQFDDFTIEGR